MSTSSSSSSSSMLHNKFGDICLTKVCPFEKTRDLQTRFLDGKVPLQKQGTVGLELGGNEGSHCPPNKDHAGADGNGPKPKSRRQSLLGLLRSVTVVQRQCGTSPRGVPSGTPLQCTEHVFTHGKRSFVGAVALACQPIPPPPPPPSSTGSHDTAATGLAASAHTGINA
mmetsp:Transcript_69965/g.140841  ORF Transcript_69965/g.140841 Transcript_69965/m.140841 type:complete len:169 (+) Transcript_69965:91-597(+)